MSITINEELRAYIDPLTDEEFAALEQSILLDGCRDPLVLWGEVLVDGHNRYTICQKHQIPFNTIQNTKFQSMDDVHLWMINNHLGRRSVSDFQRGVLALRKKEILSTKQESDDSTHKNLSSEKTDAETEQVTKDAKVEKAHTELHLNRQQLAREAKLSSATLGKIEKIQKEATPQLVDAIKTGLISISAAADVASLPVEKQVEAVSAGKKELRLAAKEVREARLPPKPVIAALPDDATDEEKEIHQLTVKLAALTEERDQLKKKIQHLTIALKEARGE